MTQPPIQFTRPDHRIMHLQPWSLHDLDEMAVITPNDVDKAEAYWRRLLPRKLRDILSAREVHANPNV
jgi:hypothetical protein